MSPLLRGCWDRLRVLILHCLVVWLRAPLCCALALLTQLQLTLHIGIAGLSPEVEASARYVESRSSPRLWSRGWELGGGREVACIHAANEPTIGHVLYVAEVLWRRIELGGMRYGRLAVLVDLVVVLHVPLQLPFDVLVDEGKEGLLIEAVVEVVSDVHSWLEPFALSIVGLEMILELTMELEIATPWAIIESLRHWNVRFELHPIVELLLRLLRT